MITQEQLDFKRGKIGASQVAAALGISPFQTPAQLAMEILGRIPPQEENEAMRTGNIMEPAIAQLYMEREGFTIHPWEETEVHPQFDWLIAHPDYFYNDDAEGNPLCLIEIKNVGARQRFRWEEGVPVHVVAQCVMQSLLTGINRVEVVAYFGGSELEVFPLTITAKQHEALLTKVSLFWFDWIKKAQIPPVTHRDIELVKALYPSCSNEATPLVAVPAVMEDVKNFHEYKQMRLAMDATIGTLEAKIRLMMGNAHELNAPDGTLLFTYKQAKDSTKIDYNEVVRTIRETFTEHDDFFHKTVQENSTIREGSRQFLDKHNYDKERARNLPVTKPSGISN
jgi:putative phage-type endonuclease